jgi:hypothetical protein
MINQEVDRIDGIIIGVRFIFLTLALDSIQNRSTAAKTRSLSTSFCTTKFMSSAYPSTLIVSIPTLAPDTSAVIQCTAHTKSC